MKARIGRILTRRVLPAQFDWVFSLAAVVSLGWLTASSARSLLNAQRVRRLEWDDWFVVIWWLTWCVVTCIVLGVRHASGARKRQILNADERGLCGRCGYDLHCLRTNRCPECGTYFLMKRELLAPPK